MKSEYGRPSRSAIVREMLPICASSSSSTDERATRDPCDELDRPVVVGRAEPPGNEAEVCGERLAESVLEVFDGIADDGDRRRLETEADSLGSEEGPFRSWRSPRTSSDPVATIAALGRLKRWPGRSSAR